MFSILGSILGNAVGAAYHIVSALAQVLSPLPWGLATAAAIVVFTLGVRLVLLPLSYYALRGQAAQARAGEPVAAQRCPQQGMAEQAVAAPRDGR